MKGLRQSLNRRPGGKPRKEHDRRIGRDDSTPNECSVFRFKKRHGDEVDVDVQTDLQYMRFLGTEQAPATEAPGPAVALN